MSEAVSFASTAGNSQISYPTSEDSTGPGTKFVFVDDLQRIRDFYQIPNFAGISDFLSRHWKARSAIADAIAVIPEFFPERTGASIYERLNEEGDIDYVVVKIRSDLDIDDALSRRANFDENWWLQRIGAVRREVIFDLE